MHTVYSFSSVHLVHSRWVTSGVPTLHSSLTKALRRSLKLQNNILASLKPTQFILKQCEKKCFHSLFGVNLLQSAQAFACLSPH